MPRRTVPEQCSRGNPRMGDPGDLGDLGVPGVLEDLARG